jgi:hypothetical protein
MFYRYPLGLLLYVQGVITTPTVGKQTTPSLSLLFSTACVGLSILVITKTNLRTNSQLSLTSPNNPKQPIKNQLVTGSSVV